MNAKEFMDANWSKDGSIQFLENINNFFTDIDNVEIIQDSDIHNHIQNDNPCELGWYQFWISETEIYWVTEKVL